MREKAGKGEKAHRWKGDEVGYHGLHWWVKKVKGTPDTCQNCKTSGLKGIRIHWANISHKYKRDEFDWIRLCVSCHRAFDLKNIEKYLSRRQLNII